MKPSRYIADLESGCSSPQLQQSIFLYNRDAGVYPDTYISDICTVASQGRKARVQEKRSTCAKAMEPALEL